MPHKREQLLRWPAISRKKHRNMGSQEFRSAWRISPTSSFRYIVLDSAKPNFSILHGQHGGGRTTIKCCDFYENADWQSRPWRLKATMGEYELRCFRIRGYSIWALQQNRNRHRHIFGETGSQPDRQNRSRRCQFHNVRRLHGVED